MSILNWTIHVDIPSRLSIQTEEGSFAIVGDGSLSMEHSNTNSFTHANLIPNDVDGLPHGIVPAGRLRTICRIDVHEGTAPQTSYFGITALQSQDSLLGSGSCYALLVSSNEGLVNPVLHLHKFTSGLTNGLTAPSLVSMPFPFISSLIIGEPFTLELDWVVDVPGLGGTFLIARTGSALDFSDLEVQMTYVDTSSPLTTSVAEGIVGSFKSGTILDTKKVLFDNTTLFELV